MSVVASFTLQAIIQFRCNNLLTAIPVTAMCGWKASTSKASVALLERSQ